MAAKFTQKVSLCARGGVSCTVLPVSVSSSIEWQLAGEFCLLHEKQLKV